MKTEVFEKKSIFDSPPETIFAWHERPGALGRLTPPWEPTRIIEPPQGIRVGARVKMKVKIGPLWLDWIAEHTDYEKNRYFVDEQKRGPFSLWRHSHIFNPADGNRTEHIDRIEYRLPLPPFGNLFGGRTAAKRLEKMFRYRRQTLADELLLHSAYADRPRLDIAISGAGGVLGSSLVDFLTTGGHRVRRLVRRKPAEDAAEVFFNPATGEIDSEALGGVDAIIHLAGEQIGDQRWTAQKKQEIIDSRENGTRLLAEAAARLNPKPAVFISASAIGYYGDSGTEPVCETDQCGDLFISEVCRLWEEAAAPVAEAGIRLAIARIGVVLTPAGGALAKMAPVFRAGLGGRIGDGSQFISWLAPPDFYGAINTILFENKIAGPVNLVAPNPVKNSTLARTLAQVMSRPAATPAPSWAVETLYGQMGRETALAGCRVAPNKLLEAGYSFLYPELEGALRYIIGSNR